MKRPIELKNHQREISNFRFRLIIGIGFVLTLSFLLLLRFVYLQAIRYEHFHAMGENNRISVVPAVPSRGLILDRNGVVLARNYSGYTLEIKPSEVPHMQRTLEELGQVIEIQPKDLKHFKKLLGENHSLESLPIRVRLSDEEVARFAAQRYRFPGVEIRARLFREYPFGEGTAHLIGYIGRINQKDADDLASKELSANYRGSDYIGKTGLEQSYETELHGTTGAEEVEVDAAGRAVRVLSRTAPRSGNNLMLSLDAKLQQIAEEAFGKYRGALVAIDPNNGEILAFVSKPGYDPNLFVDGIDTENWEALNNSPDVPLNNRALRGQYPPGSTIKPFMALTGLHFNVRTGGFSISDAGQYYLPGSSHAYRDWKVGGHGQVDMFKSIVISCDTFYYGLAVDLGIDRISSYLPQFGFGSKTGVDMEGEVSGLLPSAEWKMKRYKQQWFTGDTVSVGIGQGYNLVTPLQLASATATLANNGVAYRPHFVKQIQAASGEIRALPNQAIRDLQLPAEHIDLVKRAMYAVTQPGGTASGAAAGAPYMMAGKTGTAQVIAIKQGQKYNASLISERYRDHAWFMSFAPLEHPKIAVAVLVENGGHGGSVAAPIARKMFDYYLLGKEPKPITPELGKEETEHD
ncbi:MAG: hypothetical protein RLZZ144_527 [Pseudomonadota bacterium]